MRARLSPLLPVGRSTLGRDKRPKEEWIEVAEAPGVVSREQFERVQEKLSKNQAFAARNNTAHEYLLKSLVSCGHCGGACAARTSGSAYGYYYCMRASRPGRGGLEGTEERCPARFIPRDQLEERVWADLCEVIRHPERIGHAIERAHGGQWLPQDLKARREQMKKAIGSLEKQGERLTDAYLAGVIGLEEFERRRTALSERIGGLERQSEQLDAGANRAAERARWTASAAAFCRRVAEGLDRACFEERRRLVELLIDRVVVKDDDVEIRYVVPLSSDSEHLRFCHLRCNYSNGSYSAHVTVGSALGEYVTRRSPSRPLIRSTCAQPHASLQLGNRRVVNSSSQFTPWGLPRFRSSCIAASFQA